MTSTTKRSVLFTFFLGALPLLANGCGTEEEVEVSQEDDVNTSVNVDAVHGDTDADEFRAWTGYVSEEDPPTICPNNYAVRGFHCMGDYCDNVAINCRPLVGAPFGESIWTPYFSEEGSGPDKRGRCAGPQRWMTGVACSGSYCDNLSIRCTAFPGTSPNACEWSSWYSEEQPRFNAPAGYFIKAIECDGSYCDNKRFRYCRRN